VSALAAKPFRIIGFVEVTETGGVWAGPTKIRLFGAGMHKPCETVQMKVINSNPSNTCGVGTPGLIFSAVTVNLTSPYNPVRITSYIPVQVNGGSFYLIWWSNSATVSSPTFTSLGQGGVSNAGSDANVVLYGMFQSGLLTPQFTLWCQITNTSTQPVLNSSFSYFQFEEIMGALEPMNDNGLPISMVG
jgi:hypothetical protein